MTAAITNLVSAILGLLFLVGGLTIGATKSGIGGWLIALAGVAVLPMVRPKLRGLLGGREWLTWVAPLVLALVVGPLTMGADKPEKPKADKQLEQEKERSEKAARECDNTTAAFVMSQGFVKDKLKSPSSAEFPMITDGVKVSKTGKCAFNVSAYVDAQNSFGAMLRQTYVADLEYTPESDSWRLINLTMQ
ncbi:hypothetical protein NJI34_41645 [Pseudomonas sp. S 311-6]|nr:hypothetical protein [Pseudomonas sp. S 311-6]